MTAQFDWNRPEFDSGSFHKWAAEGDTIEGVITGMSSHTFPAKGELGMADYQGPQTYPVLCIDTAAGEKELTVSNVDLLVKTKAKNPQIGDWYSAAWVATAGKKRIFLVVVKKETVKAAVPTTQGAIDAQVQAIAAAAQEASLPF